MSKALLIMAHGSRAEAANDEFRLLVEQVAPLILKIRGSIVEWKDSKHF